ncbi:MAG: PAS domain S-box protein, partial [Methanoregula sp.]|nr:PAS domain S-box protein [Methanoregula sp.]
DSGTLIEYQSVGRDITEKKQAENESTEYQTRLKEVIEFLPDATLAIDRQKRIIVWNKAIEQMTGIPAAEMIGKGDYAYAVPFYGEARPQLMDLVFEDSEEIAARYPAIRRESDALMAEVFCNALYNNKGAWVFAKASPLYDSYGNIVGAIESIRDITDRTVAEQGLQKSEALLRDIIEKNPMSIQIVDREGYTLKVNPAFMQLFGSVPPPDFSIITNLVKSHPELENLISQVKSGEAVNLPDMCFNPHDIYPELPDVPTRVRTIIFPLNDRYGKPESFVFMHENITGCKQAEESLAESEQKFQSLVEHALEGILILDLQGKVLFANNAAARTLEIDDRAGLIGRNVMEFVAPESLEDVVKDFIEVSHGHDAYLAQYNAISAKGNKFTLESIGKVVSYEGKPADLISIRDITERKQAEVALSQSEEKFRTLFEKMTPGVFYQLSDGTLTDANPAALRMFGMTSGQFMGRDSYDPRWRVISETGELLSPDQHPSMIALKSGKPVRDLVVGVFNPQTDETTWLSTNAEPQFRNGEATPYQVFVTMYDITGRRQAEKDLLESHERFRATIASLDDAIFLVDPVTRVISECNDAATRIFGYVREELVGRQTGVLHVDQAHLEQFSQEVNASYEEPGFYTREFEMRRKDGCVFPTEHFVRPIKDNNGRLMYVVSVVRDITERKQAEVVLKESEERFHSMFERHDSVMLLIDPETGKIIDANLAAAQFYGRSQEELCSQSIDEINCLSKEEFAAERMKALREKKNFFIFPHRIASGEIRTVEVHSSPIEVGGKTVLFSIISDITERIRSENALKESEEKYRDIFENSVNGLFKINPDGALIAVNDAFARIYDYSSAAEMIADNQKQENLYISNKLYANPEDRKEIYRILAEKGKVENFETMHCKRDGTRIWMSITARFVRDPEGTVLFVEGTIIDITDRKRAEEAFKAAKEYAETLIQTANAMVIGLDSHGTITLFNKAAEAITGYTAAELAGRNWFRVIVPKEQYPHVWEEFNRLLMGGLPIDFENPILTKSGEERYIVWKNSEIRNNEETAWIISFGIDITERKRAEELLRESEKKYRFLFDNLTQGFALHEIILDESGVPVDYRFLVINPAFEQLTGLHSADLIGRTVREVLPGTEPSWIERYGRVALSGVAEQFEDYHAALGRWFDVRAYRNQHLQFAVVFTDITGRKNTEVAFQAMIRSMVGTTGFNSLQKITENINIWLGAECVMVGEIQPDRQTVKVLSMLLDGKNIPDFTYTLKGTPCDNVAEKGFCIYPDNVIGLFPESKDLVDLNIRGYIGTPLRNSQGHVVGILCALFREPVKASPAVQEIMNIIAVKAAAEIERKRAEEELKASEGKLNAMLQSIPDHISMMDKDLNLIWTNETAKRVFGDDIVGKKCYEIYHQRQNPCEPYPCLTLQAFQDGKVHKHETSVIDVNGQVIYFECSANVALNDDCGKPVAVLEVSRDITGRKRAEELLNESARYTRNLIEVSLDPLVTISPEGKITDVNAATERVTGYTRNHLIGTDFSDYFTDPVNAKKGYMMVFEDGVVRDYPLEIRHRDGKVTPVMYNATIYPDESGNAKGIFAAARDITERKMAEEALHLANKKLKLLSSITRHDINNQLTVLIGYLTILKRKQPDPVLNEYFVKVSTAAQRISSMIQFTKEYESIGVKAPAWQNCCTVADTAAKDAQPGQIRIKNDILHSAEVFTDPLVVKVFYNLIDNAVRYGGKITTIRFFVEERDGDHIVVCEDDGDGVVAEEKEKIFERDFGKNTGLGLALAREILDITGITIKECGEPGKGARFEMTVPKGAWRIRRTDENKE